MQGDGSAAKWIVRDGSHPARLPLTLQDAHPVRFRNIWLRELK